MSKDQPTPANSGARPNSERSAAAPKSASAAAAPTDNSFLSSLADLESRINTLKSAHEQAASRDMELSGKEAAITAREQDLTERERAIAARLVKAEAEMSRAQRELAEADAARTQAADSLKQITTQREQDEQMRAAFERDRAAFAAEQQRLQQERNELEFDVKLQREEIERDRAGVAEHARTLAEQMKRSDDEHNAAIWSNRLEAIQIELGESNAARARIETELAQTREDVQSLTQELIEANQNKGVPAEELEKRDRAISELSAKLDENKAMTTMLQQQVEQAASVVKTAEAQRASADAQRAREAGDRESAMKAAEAKASDVAAKLSATVRELEEATKLLASRDRSIAESQRFQKETADRASAANQECDALKRELAAARELLEQADAVAKASVSADEVRNRDAAIAGLEQALKEAERNSAELARQERESGQSAIAELADKLKAAERNASEAATHAATQAAGEAAEALTSQIRERDERIAALDAEINALKESSADRVPVADLAERDRTIAKLRAELDDAIEQATRPAPASQPAGPDEETLREIAKRDEAITILKERLRDALAAAQNSTSSSDTTDGSGPSEADYRRRDRLRRYKSMLQSQARKIVAAQSAIQRRHSDCEQVLSHRSKLAQLAQQLSRAEKKITSSKARSGAAAAVLYFAATLGILAVMSWEVSKRVWPGTYIARAVIDADTGRHAPKPEDYASWQKDHSELLGDPRLMEVAAQRMQQRGLAALGTPGELASRLKQDMYVQSAKPGSLTVELRGEGAEKTALILDTVITAFKSVADQGKDERSNDMGVVIAQAAAPGTEPLMDKRIEKAGSVFAGAALAAGLAGLVIWSRLVKAKKKFDQAAAVDAALGEVDWATLEASIKQNAAAKS